MRFVCLTLMGVWAGSSAVMAGESPPRVDRFGDPLPQGAVVRLGTVQFRHSRCACVAFAPDGKMLASGGRGTVWFWDPATGKRIKQIPHGAEALAFSPNGKNVAIAGPDGTVRLWDVEKTKQLFAHRPKPEDGTHSARLRDIAFSPDGTWFASADDRGIVRLWDAASGEEILVLRHGDERNKDEICLEISADARLLASACENNIRVWDIEQGGEPLLIKKAHDRKTTALAFSLDGKALYSAGLRYELVGTARGGYRKSHSQIRVWDAHTGRRTGEVAGEFEGDRANRLVLTADGKSLVVSFYDTIRVFDLISGKLRFSIPLHKRTRSYRRGVLDVSPDGQTVAVAMEGSSFQVWDLKTRTQRHAVPEAHVAMVRAVAFSPHGKTAITGSYDGTVRIWNSATGEQIRKLVYSDRPMNLMSVAISPAGNVLAAAGNYRKRPVETVGAVKLWNAASGKLLHEIRLSGCGFAMAFSPDGKRLATATMGGIFAESGAAATIHLIDVESGKAVADLAGHAQTVLAVGFSPDSSELVSIGEDKTIRVWDLAKGKPKQSSNIEIEYVTAAAISADAAMSVFCKWGPASRMTLWDVTAAKSMRLIDGFTSGYGAHGLDISRDGKLLASGCGKHTLRVWNMATASQLLELTCPDAKVFALAFSPNGRQLITGMDDGTALIWDTSRACDKLAR